MTIHTRRKHEMGKLRLQFFSFFFPGRLQFKLNRLKQEIVAGENLLMMMDPNAMDKVYFERLGDQKS